MKKLIFVLSMIVASQAMALDCASVRDTVYRLHEGLTGEPSSLNFLSTTSNSTNVTYNVEAIATLRSAVYAVTFDQSKYGCDMPSNVKVLKYHFEKD